MDQRTYSAIFFDLDGTLLPIDMDRFIQEYFKSLAGFAAKRGHEPESFLAALGKGVRAMASAEVGPNDEKFWGTFCPLIGKSREELEPMLDEYYRTAFNDLGTMVTPAPEAGRVVTKLRAKGYPLYLTTMPLFPRVAVEARLNWAGVPVDAFDRIATYTNSTCVKPHAVYYQENIDAIGLAPERILMVGNNTLEDLAACKLGLDGYLATNWILNPNDFDISTVKHGTLAEFEAFVDALPECE